MDIREQLKSRLRVEEGFRPRAYRDSLGHLTIGYGLLLEGPDVERLLRKEGLSPTAVRSGSWPITIEQADRLLDYTAGCAITDAGDVVGPKTWGELPMLAQIVLSDMTFQLGMQGVRGFQKMLAALRALDYLEASKQMLDSLWAKQTPARCQGLARLMASCAAPLPPSA